MTPNIRLIARSTLATALVLGTLGQGLLIPGLTKSASADHFVPEGQLTRRGISGTVLSYDGSTMVVETNFGNVTVDVGGASISFAGPAPKAGEDGGSCVTRNPGRRPRRSLAGSITDRSSAANHTR